MDQLTRPSRLISIDIMKGIGILGMLFSHAFFKGIWYTEGNAAIVVGEHAPWVIVLAAPLIIMGTWPGFFILITGLLNSYLVIKRVEKGRSLKQAVFPLYVSALLFLIIHALMVSLLHDYRPNIYVPGQSSAGLFGNLLAGNGFKIDERQWYIHSILSMLAFANVFFALTLRWLFRNEAWKDIRSTGTKLIILAIIILILGAILGEPSYQLILKLHNWGGPGHKPLIFILQGLCGSQLDLLPLASYGCLGMIVSLFLSNDPLRKNYQPLGRFLNRSGWVTLICGVMLIIIRVIRSEMGPVDAIFIYEPYPLHLAVFNMGPILFIMAFGMKHFEYAPVNKLKKITEKTLFLRSAGVLTLSLYVFEFPVRALFTFAGHMIWGNSTDPLESFRSFAFDDFMLNPAAIFIFMIIVMSFWSLLILTFRKLRFRASMEWFFVRIANLFRRNDKSMKANMDAILYPFD